jgi:hypothetical protein
MSMKSFALSCVAALSLLAAPVFAQSEPVPGAAAGASTASGVAVGGAAVSGLMVAGVLVGVAVLASSNSSGTTGTR